MKEYLSPLVLIAISLVGCKSPTPDNGLHYSTSSDSTHYYYNLGWQQIMDEGHYSQAEVSYRKALEFDPDFLIGLSVLARLTTDLEERLEIYSKLEESKHLITDDERLVLDVYLALVRLTNIREQEPEKSVAVLKETLELAEDNLQKVVHKYPGGIYLKAEYIEVLHANHGPEVALDSLSALTTVEQKENPFLLGYRASMLSEIGNYNEALLAARRLERIMAADRYPKPSAVFADIYFRMDSLQLAKQYVDQAFALDSGNLDASRLKARIDKAIEDNSAVE